MNLLREVSMAAGQLAQSNSHKAMCTERLAQSALHRATEQLAQSSLRRATEQLAQSSLRRAAEPLAQSNLRQEFILHVLLLSHVKTQAAAVLRAVLSYSKAATSRVFRELCEFARLDADNPRRGIIERLRMHGSTARDSESTSIRSTPQRGHRGIRTFERRRSESAKSSRGVRRHT